MLVPGLSRQDREQKGEIGIVRVEKQQTAQIHPVVSGYRGEQGIQLVVRLDIKIAVRIGKHAGKFSDQPVRFVAVSAIDDDRQGELPQRLTITQGSQAIAKILDIRLL